MKIKNKVFKKAIYLAMIIICSCQNNKVSSELTTPFQIDLFASDSSVSIDHVIKNVKFIQLGLVNDKSSALALPKKILYESDKYYILDSKSTEIKAFNSDGSFAFTIGKLGRGPGEYKKINDFQIFRNKLEVLVDNTRLLKYSLKGDFIQEQKLDFYASEFERFSDNEYVFFINNNVSDTSGKYNILYTSMDLKVKGKDFSFSNIETPSYDFTGFLMKAGHNVLFSEPFNEAIYSINSTGNKIAYKFNFGDLKLPDKIKEDFNLFMKEGIKYSYIGNIAFEKDKHLFFSYKNGKRIEYAIFNNKDNTLYKQDLTKNYINQLYSTPLGVTSNGELITVIITEKFLEFIEKNDIKEIDKTHPDLFNIIQHFNESSNPIIMLFKL